MWAKMIAPENAPTVGLIGLILSLVGFAVTLYQVLKTRRAAESAQAAANATSARFSAFNAMREYEIARQQVQRVNDAIAQEDWDAVLVAYQPLLTSMSNIRQCNAPLDDGVREALQDGEDRVTRNCQTIEKAVQGKTNLTKGKQFSALRPIDAVLAKTLFNIERIG